MDCVSSAGVCSKKGAITMKDCAKMSSEQSNCKMNNQQFEGTDQFVSSKKKEQNSAQQAE